MAGREELGQHLVPFDEETLGSEEAGQARLFHKDAGRLCGLLSYELGLDGPVVWLPEPRQDPLLDQRVEWLRVFITMRESNPSVEILAASLLFYSETGCGEGERALTDEGAIEVEDNMGDGAFGWGNSLFRRSGGGGQRHGQIHLGQRPLNCRSPIPVCARAMYIATRLKCLKQIRNIINSTIND